MSKISFSQYQMWKQCPHRWKLLYVDKIKVHEPSIILCFGTAMHTVIQAYLTTYYNSTIKSADAIDLCEQLKLELIKEYKLSVVKNEGKPFSTPEEMKEYFTDGCNILNWIRKNKTKYFPKTGYELVGMEYPIDYLPSEKNKNVNLIGYLDIVVRNIETGKICIYDLKTSVNGWNKYAKADKTKISQLVLYKSFYADQYNIPPDDIDIQYVILKRKVDEDAEFPAMRKYIQLFVPASGRVSRNYIRSEIDMFVEKCFNDDGTKREDAVHLPIAGEKDKNCRFCVFKERYDLCPKENRTK
ncbi:PD-(D/E)XK nuclease superfamily [Microcystis phage Mel-JY01]